MRTVLFYFSSTGNSLHVARELAKSLGDTEVVSIPVAMKTPGRVAAERVGIVFPVYAWGMPRIVAEFCGHLEAQPSAYVFGAATCGGNAAGTLRQLRAVLASRGLTLSSGFVLRMPGNYTPMYGAPAARSQERMFAKVAERLPGMLDVIRAGGPGPVDGGSWTGNLLLSRWVHRGGMSRFRGADRNFWVDSRCDGCGMCARVCPVEDIAMRDSRPTWLHHCEQCMACLQWCPKEAIQCGKRTAGRTRYHHPDARVRDFILRGN